MVSAGATARCRAHGNGFASEPRPGCINLDPALPKRGRNVLDFVPYRNASRPSGKVVGMKIDGESA